MSKKTASPRLFTYIIPVDDGAAPNPFNGMCTLAICKPSIRRVAKKGDWVVGLGSKNAPSGDLSGCVVYAMLVEEVHTMSQYDKLAPKRWPFRIPNVKSAALQDRLGDCIYDFSSGKPKQRKGVHGRSNIARDLGGENVLVSRRFYYFGNRAIPLPDDLRGICHQTQGHRSNSNDRYVKKFIAWICGTVRQPGQLYGWPDFIVDWSAKGNNHSCITRLLDDDSPEC